MQILKRIFNRGEQRSTSRSSKDPYLAEIFGMRQTSAGVDVTRERAEGLSAVFACVTCISESVAGLPIHLFKRTEDGGRERNTSHPVYRVLEVRPNPFMTPFELKELLIQHLLLRGNAYCEVKTDAAGRVSELIPLNPDSMRPELLENGRLRYHLTVPAGGTRVLLQEEVFHLKGRSDDGILGKTPITVAREVLGLAIAEQEHGAATFRNGTRLSGVLKHPAKLADDAYTRLRDQWQAAFSGVGMRGKTAILEGGMEWQQLSMSLEDALWVESRRMTLEDVARLFRVPPTMIGDLTHGNYSNSVEMARSFVTHTLRPHLRRFEEAVERCLFTESARKNLFVEFETKSITSADIETRFKAYQLALDPDRGWMTKGEVRRAENLPPEPTKP
jgi:HK97 family phage portal protein